MTWSNEWPTEPGWYWFYGYAFGNPAKGEKKRLETVRVQQIGGGSFAYIASGAFMWKSESGGGIWCPMTVPDLPEGEDAGSGEEAGSGA